MGEDEGEAASPSATPRRVPVPLQRLPKDHLRRLYRALAELEEAGLREINSVEELRAAIAAKAGLSAENIPPEFFTTETMAMSMWAWTPNRWKSALEQHGLPRVATAPEGEGAGEGESCSFKKQIARAKANMKRRKYIIGEDGEITREEEAAGGEEPAAEAEDNAAPEAADEEAPGHVDFPFQGGGEEAMAAARASLDQVDMASLQELKCLAKPPRGITDVLSAVSMIIHSNEAELEWKAAQKLMANPWAFRSSLQNFNIEDGVPPPTMDRLERLLGLPWMVKDEMKKKSLAAACILTWVWGVFYVAGLQTGRGPPRRLTPLEVQAREDPPKPAEEEASPQPARKSDEDPVERIGVWWRAMLKAGAELESFAAPDYSLPTMKGDGPGVLFARLAEAGAYEHPKAKPSVMSVTLGGGSKHTPPKTPSIISLHVGGDGCGMGLASWRRLIRDHGLSEAGPDGGPLGGDPCADAAVHFSEASSGGFTARAVFALSGGGGLAEARSVGCAPVDVHETPEPDGRTWADAMNEGASERLMESLRRQLEQADHCACVMVTHSLHQDGFDSGLACTLLPELKHQVGKKLIWSLATTPSGGEDEPVHCLNAVLSVSRGVMEYTDLCTFVDRESLFQLASAEVNGLGLAEPSLQDCWKMTSGVIAAWSSPLSIGKGVSASEGTRLLSPINLTSNLVPYPRIHFCGASYAPFLSEEMAKFGAGDGPSIVWNALTGGSMSKGISGKRIACALLCRGVGQFEALPKVAERRGAREAAAVDWCAGGFCVGSHAAGAGGGQPQAEAACLHSSCGIGPLIGSWNAAIDSVSCEEKAKYFQGAFCNGDIEEAHEDMLALARDYEEVGIDSHQ